MLVLKNVNKIYHTSGGDVTALHNINLSIPVGSFAALIGESGSGKSTLLSIAGCLDRATNGEVFIGGKNVSSLTDDETATLRREKIGFIFQSFYLQANMTALENVMLPLMLGGILPKERKRLAADMLRQVGMQDRLHHRPSQLSGGQKQRVAIARALICSPKLILADEPTGNLDSVTADGIMNLLKDLGKKGITVLMVTHNKNHAAVADLCFEIKDGEIINS